MKDKVYIFLSPDQCADFLVEKWFEIGRAAQKKHGNFLAALSGGNTPELFYRKLSNSPNNKTFWKHTHIFQVDERLVPPDSDQNNYRMIHRLLLEKVPLSSEKVHRIETGSAGDQVAEDYEHTLRECMKSNLRTSLGLDLVLLGVGEDGHTASIFPDTIACNEHSKLISHVPGNSVRCGRITMTFPLLNRADQIYVLAFGKGKARIIRDILEGEDTNYPISNIRPITGSCSFLLDEESASLLSER